MLIFNRIDKYIKEYIPSREDFEQIKFRLINGEAVRFLARIRVSVDTKKDRQHLKCQILEVREPELPVL